jgi:hypothetical protein
MARSVARDGTHPTKTRTVKRENGIDLELPYCNICDTEMNKIRLSALLVWKPGFKYTRKFPLQQGAFLCDPCREEEGFGPTQFIAVPCAEGVDKIEAMKEYIALMEEAAQVT